MGVVDGDDGKMMGASGGAYMQKFFIFKNADFLAKEGNRRMRIQKNLIFKNIDFWRRVWKIKKDGGLLPHPAVLV